MATYVRFIAPAVDDLRELEKQDPQLVREALKECLLLEHSAMAGEALLGSLAGMRKLTLGDRHRRLVWRVKTEGEDTVVEIAEVWTVDRREDKDAYAEVERRLKTLGNDPRAIPLAEVIASLGRHAKGVETRTETQPTEPLPDWIRNGLRSAGVSEAEIDAMSPDDALTELQKRWS